MKERTTEYTPQEAAAMKLADEYRGRILRRTGLKREELCCPREKSDMTPCVARDGGLAVCLLRGVTPACVGCEWTLKGLNAKEDADGASEIRPALTAEATNASEEWGYTNDLSNRVIEMMNAELKTEAFKLAGPMKLLAALMSAMLAVMDTARGLNMPMPFVRMQVAIVECLQSIGVEVRIGGKPQ
jgi:hypothetical protein